MFLAHNDLGKMAKKKILLSLIILLIIFISYLFLKKPDTDLVTADLNGNGVWDDYEAVIEKKFSDKPNLKNAALQTGKAMQDLLDLADVLEKDKTYAKAMACLVAAGEFDGLPFAQAAELILEVRDIVISNDARQFRYIKYNSAVSGHMLPVYDDELEYCEFPIQKSGR